MLAPDRLDFFTHAAQPYQLFSQVEEWIDEKNIDPLLRHLIKLRVSQINGCAFCVEMHTREARESGEVNQRLDLLVSWREVDLYSEAEKAALAWAEALTIKGSAASLEMLHQDLKRHFSEEDSATLTAIVVMINAWNRIAIASHNSCF